MSWVVLELSPRSEGEDPDVIRRALANSLKKSEIFIPAAVTQRREDRVVTYLMEGYAFVRLDRQPQEYFKLEGTKFVQSVLALPGANGRQRKLSTVKDEAIDQMREQIRLLVDQGISVGDLIRITSGPYKNMEARVVEEIPEQGMVQVHVTLRSKQSLVALPRAFLTVVSRAPLSGVSNRLTALREWAQAALPVVQWSSPFDHVLDAYIEYAKVEAWRAKCAILYDILSLDTAFPQPLAEAIRKAGAARQLSGWQIQARQLYDFIAFQHGSLTEQELSSLHGRMIELLWIDNLLERIRLLWEDVEGISSALAQRHEHHEGKGMTQNIIIDGNNLAYRCHYAPGMNSLVDSKGRPTGILLGFLRSVGSFRKRFPDAAIYVTWDGSSKRRRSRFSEYKAQRNSADISGSIDVLRRVLPLLGIRQAVNPDEEADDIIATLSRVNLATQRNIILSTDKDMLQLVTDDTSVLVPAVGSRNEVLHDTVTVLETIGVPPNKVVQLRAFYGDTSDNIPGVPRVPKKVLRALVQAYGSVEAVYQSGLTGVTKGQYERLRSAEPQVRINLELMSLVDVSASIIPPDVDPDNAAAVLKEYDIAPDTFLETFFGRA